MASNRKLIGKIGNPENKYLQDVRNRKSRKGNTFRDAGRAVMEANMLRYYEPKFAIFRSILHDNDVALSSQSPHHRGIPTAIANYLGEDENINICKPLNVHYLKRQMEKSENFFMASYGVGDRAAIIPKTMIVWRFLGGHIHVIAFCTNNKDNNEKGGGLFMLSLLKRFCELANIPCITLYALSNAEGYYENKAGFIYADTITDQIDGGGHRAMVWWNRDFLPGEYKLGLGKVKNHDIDHEDRLLNNYINKNVEEMFGFADIVTGIVQMKRDATNKPRERSRSRDDSGYSSSGDEEVLDEGRKGPDGNWIITKQNNQIRNDSGYSSSGDEEVLDEGIGRKDSQGRIVWKGGSRRRRKTKKLTRRKKTIHKKRKSHKNP